MRLLLAAALFLVACTTPKSRIAKNPEKFNAYPAEVQETIKKGQISIGFTKDQVEFALGKPDRVYKRTGSEGEQEIWAYTESGSPGTGVSVGGLFGYGGGVMGGVSVGTGDDYYHRSDEKTRVVFTGDRVSAIETRERS